jgi:formate hydrogenlyase transcriptional activator
LSVLQRALTPELDRGMDSTTPRKVDNGPKAFLGSTGGPASADSREQHNSREDLERALGESRDAEARLRKIIDTIPTLAWCNLPDGSNEFLNQRWHDYTGLSPQEGHGCGWKVTIHPEDLPKLLERWSMLLASGEPGEIEARFRRHDGEYRWFLFRIEPLRDDFGNILRWYGTNTDIDDLKRAQMKFLLDEEELRRITDAIPQTIVVLNPEGRAIYANRVALEYTGLTLDEVRGENFRERIFHPEDVARIRRSSQGALSSNVPFENKQRALGKDGKYRWFLVRYNPFRDPQGRVVRWYATGTDIDDRRRSEERIRNENVALREEIARSSLFEEIVGSSRPLRQVLTNVSKVAPTDSTVLILGETGTGKELIARAIHNQSNRSTRAFIRVNCAAIPPSLVASELFGYERGAFTATNSDLSAAVAEGTFRRDLFYRLNVFPIRVPPLRERVDDIPLLVEYLIDRYSQKVSKRIRNASRETLSLFRTYDWPGNIRELQNVIERAMFLCEGETFSVDPAWLTRTVRKSTSTNAPLIANLIEHEKEMIEQALREAAGQISGPKGAAVKLGIPRQTLESRIKKLGIHRHSFKTS